MSSLLRNALGGYLDGIENERVFDAPLLALLSTMGYYDIHFTHGQAEFGKDFIAKKTLDDGIVIQCAFQSKRGNINQSEWRSDIGGQMREAATVSLSHPNFDETLTRQSVLVTTGRLTGNTALEAQDLSRQIMSMPNQKGIDVWDREKLIDLILENGLEAVQPETSTGYKGHGNFYIVYGKCLERTLTIAEIEEHSQYWLEDSYEPRQILRAIIESAIISHKCSGNQDLYVAFQSELGALRAVLRSMHISRDEMPIVSHLQIIHDRLIELIHSTLREYVTSFKTKWDGTDKDLATAVLVPPAIFVYPVHCLRILEIAGFLFFLTGEEERGGIADFISELVDIEPGCSHIPSDRYAVSLVPAIIALVRAGRVDQAKVLIQSTLGWLYDRYKNGRGLASLADSPDMEIEMLLGTHFEFVQNRKRSSSFTATILADLSAFVEDKQFYADVVNDILAADIMPEYFQPSDSANAYTIRGKDIGTSPNVEFQDNFDTFESYSYAEHILTEPRNFKNLESVPATSFIGISLLLRDRYFPTLWTRYR